MISICKEFAGAFGLWFGKYTQYLKALFSKQLSRRKNRIFINLLL